MRGIIGAEALDGVASAVSKLCGDAPVAVVAIQRVAHTGEGRTLDVVGGTCAVDITMAGALALYLIQHAIAGYQAQAQNGGAPGPTFARLKAAAAALTPDHGEARHDS